MNPDIPVPTEKDYREAARANAAVYFAESGLEAFGHYFDETAKRIAKRPDFVAAVDSAYAAGWRAGYDHHRRTCDITNPRGWTSDEIREMERRSAEFEAGLIEVDGDE